MVVIRNSECKGKEKALEKIRRKEHRGAVLSFRAQAKNLLERSFVPVVISTKHSAWRNPLMRSSTTLVKYLPHCHSERSEESPGKVILSLSSFRPSIARGEIPQGKAVLTHHSHFILINSSDFAFSYTRLTFSIAPLSHILAIPYFPQAFK